VSAERAAVPITGAAAGPRAWPPMQQPLPPACISMRRPCSATCRCGSCISIRGPPAIGWCNAVAADHARLRRLALGHDRPGGGCGRRRGGADRPGTPHPVDIRDKTLPQELGRDRRAISFTKGCYLGQETVARLDALGHVNRRLAVVVIAGPVAPDADVLCGSEAWGRVTSAAIAPHLGGTVALGLLAARAAPGRSPSQAIRPADSRRRHEPTA